MASLRDHVLRRLVEEVPRDDREPAAAVRRRRRVTAATALVGAGLLGVSLSSRPGSPRFFAVTGATALTWVAGGLAAGRLHLGRTGGPGETPRRPVVAPVLTGAAAFAVFYAGALVARRVPVLERAISSVLTYADEGSPALVAVATLGNGAAEEVFFRGALYAALPRRPVVASTAAYVLATAATRNPALVLASGILGTLLALQRRVTGGIQAPMLTHLTWSALMLRYLPPLFRKSASAASRRSTSASST